uniref:SCP domain-containing protein n=1 Tax=Angiostrongylus cantonensis TaxID=6313 RepID=A0A0K0DAD2_ANGCA
MCTSCVLVAMLSTVVLLGADKNYSCGGEDAEYFQNLVKRLLNEIRKPSLLPPLNYSCDLEDLAIDAVEGCALKTPTSSEPNYTNIEHYLYPIGEDYDQVYIVDEMIRYVKKESEKREKIERSDIESVGCAADRCPDPTGMTLVSVACFYGKISDSSERNSTATTTKTTTTVTTPNEEEKSAIEPSTGPQKFASANGPTTKEFTTSTDRLTTEEDFAASTSISSIDEPLPARSPKKGLSSVWPRSEETDIVVENVAAPNRNGHFSSFLVALVMLELLTGAFHF